MPLNLTIMLLLVLYAALSLYFAALLKDQPNSTLTHLLVTFQMHNK